jgi:hypothetical protein
MTPITNYIPLSKRNQLEDYIELHYHAHGERNHA